MAGTLSQVQSNSEERHTSTAARAHSASHDLRMILGTVTHAGMTEESRPGPISAPISASRQSEELSRTRSLSVASVPLFRSGARRSTRVVAAGRFLIYKRAGARTGAGSVIQMRGWQVSCASARFTCEGRV